MEGNCQVSVKGMQTIVVFYPVSGTKIVIFRCSYSKVLHNLRNWLFVSYPPMHQSVPSVNIPSGNPRGFAPIFSLGSRDLYHLNCLGVARGSVILSIIKVPSCQLHVVLHDGTFQLQMLSCYKICFKAGGKI